MEINSLLPNAPVEPVLDMDEIQGIAVPGFFKPHQTLLYLRIPDSQEVLNHFKAFLKASAGQFATAQQTLQDRRTHREAKRARAVIDRTEEAPPLVAIAFSSGGLGRLTPGSAAIASPAFQHGLIARSSMLGDPIQPHQEGHPSHWKVGAPGKELDALIVVAGTSRKSVDLRADELSEVLQRAGVAVEPEQGDVREDLPGHEHFGFDDGVSQPGIRGRASDTPNDFITDRELDPDQIPDAWLYGLPGQDLIWPGEFVLGYPGTSPDPLVPGTDSNAFPGWTKNGSFLVFRRLRQDVGLFWRTMKDEADRLSKLPGFEHVTDEWLASRLVGRWPSGAPVSRVPQADDGYLGGDRYANNDFLFDSDTPPVKLSGNHPKYPTAKADPVGVTCPLAAHIRKVNTRDSSSDMGARTSTYDRRLLRVGVPFGKPVKDKYVGSDLDPEQGNRGLLFLSIQSCIEDQFEFLQARWINDAIRPKMPGGNDMVVGQNAPAEDGVRRCGIFGSGLEQAEVKTAKQWVIPTGGGYFFVPSISALRDVLAA
jgi:Dyp-type peroxidase family